MERKDVPTKIIAFAGALLVWFPILAPVVISVARFVSDRRFRFDYLIPAELFLLALAGGGLLLWAALRAHSRQKLIAWGLACAIGLLVGSQGLAVATGMASGETAPAGLWWALALAAIIAYDLALVAVGVGGVLLMYDLFKRV